MKKSLFTLLFFLPFLSLAQPGILTTFAGIGLGGNTGNGGPATNARISTSTALSTDAIGNVYIYLDAANGVRKVTPDGIISAYTGSSIPLIGSGGGIAAHPNGNIYITAYNSIYKKSASSGTETLFIGSGAGFSGDGGPASAAQLNWPADIYIDNTGNIFIADADNNRVRKVDTAGIINTIAGTGAHGYSGDGGPATAAALNKPTGICGDLAGNIYVADRYNNCIRKIDPAGTITTIVGTSIAGFSGDGGFATAATLNSPFRVRRDIYGNMYIADYSNYRIRKITPDGVINTCAILPDEPWGIAVDALSNLYITDRNSYRIFKLGGFEGSPAATSDSFSVHINTSCSNTEFVLTPTIYSSALTMRTFFGDGTEQTAAFIYSGSAWFSHQYIFPGTYTVKHILYNGTSPIDTLSYSYTYNFCRTLPISVFVDNNVDGTFDSSVDHLSTIPLALAVDSAGITIDTLPLTSGLHYNARGPLGTEYKFRPLDMFGLIATFPSSGHVTHTLTSLINIPPLSLGVACSSTPGHNFRLFTSFRAGIHHFGGTILAQNLHCMPSNATVVMDLNPKYTNSIPFPPVPTTTSTTSLIWHLDTLSSTQSSPIVIKVGIEKTAGVLLPYGDTIATSYNIGAISGDLDPSNNIVIRTDTVKSGYDPNDIAVSPPGCITTQTKLTYTIRFENTGNAPAYNIYVLDTLPAEVDVKSMRIEAASAVMNTYIKKVGGRNIVRFEFPDINLPDSAHGQNTGMVVFSINRNSSLPDGTHILNRVGIYFDDNPPVLTNTAENTIGCPIASVNEVAQVTKALVHPNPVNNELIINSQSGEFTHCVITNGIGQTMISANIVGSTTNLDVKNLPAGVYYLTLRGAHTEVHKVVKL